MKRRSFPLPTLPSAIDRPVLNRRDALKQIALMVGGTLSASTMAGVLGGCRAPATDEPAVAAAVDLTAEQKELIATIAELILPETDTPGARGARVHEFIELMLDDWMEPAERERFLAGLADADRRARSGFGRAFLEGSAEEQTEVLDALEQEAIATAENKGEEDDDGDKPFFARIKELTLVGYYTSEIGASVELSFAMASDAYHGCMPYSEGDRAWS